MTPLEWHNAIATLAGIAGILFGFFAIVSAYSKKWVPALAMLVMSVLALITRLAS